ncbi:hypothetical protein ACHAXT_009727 [Thalassiosira profunda]
MERAETLEEVLLAIEEQARDDEARRAIENPAPWFQLLHHPSRAAWRSTDHVLGANGREASPLSQAQANLLKHSGRTNKQLRRTYKRIMEAHKLFAVKRERERRVAANLSKPNPPEGEPDGAIKDSQGRHVGSWRDRKKQPPPASFCDDPSVQLALSMGLTNSRLDVDGETLDAMNVKSAKSAGKLAKSKSPTKTKDKPVGYGPEQALTNMKYRLGPNYSIVRRVLQEVQSLLGGKPPEGSGRESFRPKRVLDFGSGVGSSAAAALEVFGVRRGAPGGISSANGEPSTGIDWIHSIDASQPMREATEKHQTQPEDNEFAEELAEYERVMKQLRGDADQRRLERQRKKQKKWAHSWEKRTDHRTRLTFGESIADASSFYSDQVERIDRPPLPWQQQLDEQRRRAIEKKAQAHSPKGSFDLVLCAYTLAELPNVHSSLAAAALLWEKLAPNGVMVFVEPGTPDGFSMLRSVRSMLLESCPPPELKATKRAAMERAREESSEDDGEEGVSADADIWPEECHVIAPCTHNGTCPMIRHQHDHVKKNALFAKYDAAKPQLLAGEESDEDEDRAEAEEETKVPTTMMSDWEGLSEEEKEEMKEMLGAEDASDEELEAMMKYIDENEELFAEDEDDDDDSDSDGDEEEDSDDEDYGEEEDADTSGDEEEAEFYNIDQEDQPKSTTKRTGVFDTAFCSFVHSFPGGTSRKKGEKFSYLVVQKRVPGETQSSDSEDCATAKEQDALDVDIVEMLSKAVYHSQKVKEEELQMRKDRRDFNRRGYGQDDDFSREYFEKTYDTYHREKLHELLQSAVQVEDQFLDSEMDSLGMEMITGDERRKGWGRLIRAPLKKKGHVVLDYCSAGCGGCDKSGSGEDLPDGTRGTITRAKEGLIREDRVPDVKSDIASDMRFDTCCGTTSDARAELRYQIKQSDSGAGVEGKELLELLVTRRGLVTSRLIGKILPTEIGAGAGAAGEVGELQREVRGNDESSGREKGKEEGKGRSSDSGALPKASGQLHERKMASLVSGGASA